MVRDARIVICDPNDIARLGIARALEVERFVVVGVASDCESAAGMIARAPDVLLVDVSCDGLEALIGRAHLAGCIAIGTGTEAGPDRAFAGLLAGAAGYLTKDLPARAWAQGIRAALRGEAPLSRAMTARLIDAYRERQSAPSLALIPNESRLTHREWEILQRVAEGKTNRTVAEELCISVETVRTHVSNILTKLEAPNRSAAAVRYHQLVSVV